VTRLCPTSRKFNPAATLAVMAVGLSTIAGGFPKGGAEAAGLAPKAAAPQPQVVTSSYALAQLTSYIGGKAVHVVNLAPPGVQPRGLRLTPSGREAVERAALVVDVGDGYQPQVESAAKSARRHLSVLPRLSKQARPFEFWLDPFLMAKAAVLIANELVAVDPAARQEFRNGARNFQSVAVSIESDFVSTFTDCNRNEFVTSDGAFQRLASSFDLVDVAVDAIGVKKSAEIVRQDSLPTVFSEVGVPSGLLQKVAKSARATIASLNPLELTPAVGGPAPLSYFAVMEYDLTALENPLACDASGNSF
jgi:ABC-type Zn uptake system ZnuABC Zn-binding protein ZnuA